MTSTAEQLFARFRTTGDPQALGELFDRTSPQLLSLALHLCGNPADAEDALQATFVTAIARAAQWDPGRPVAPWLGGILTLHCRKTGERRARRREAELPPPDVLPAGESPVDANERRELVARLREQIDRLPVEQRQVLLLQLEHGLSPAEVAEILGVPPGTVRMRLHRAVKALRGLLPAGLVALLLGAMPARGLAAVRASVVAAATAGGPMLAAKPALAIVAALFAIGAVARCVAPPSVGRPESAASDPPPPVARAAVPPAADGMAEGAVRDDRQRVAARAPDAPPAEAAATGSLRLQFRYTNGAAVPNVPLRVVPERSDVEAKYEFLAAVGDADGGCTVSGLAPGRVRVETLGGLRDVADVSAGAVSTLRFEFDPRQALVCRVRGRVVHAEGRPAAGATIVVAPQGRSCSQPVAVADARGRFEVSLVRGFQLVGARLAGFAPSASRAFDGATEVELVLPGPGASILGVVVDAAGAAVPGAAIVVGEPQGASQWVDPQRGLMEFPVAQNLRADAAGRFVAVDLPTDPIRVAIFAPGFAPYEQLVAPTSAAPLPLRCVLAPGTGLRGQVVDAAGLPVAGASVTLGDVRRTTDAAGRFAARSLPAGPLWLRVEGPGLVARTFEWAAAPAGECTLVVARQRRFLLRFVDEHAAPLVGWTVAVPDAASPAVRTDASGHAVVFEPGSGGTLRLAPEGAIHAVMAWPLPDGLVPEVETTIVVPSVAQPAAVLMGTVLAPDGLPCAEGMVEVRGAEDSYLYRQRLADGRFRFDRVPAGDWVVEVHRPGRGSVGGRFPVAVAGREVRDLGALRLPPEGSLQLRVGGAERVPSDAAVFLFDAEGREHPEPPRDGLPHPWPAGSYRWLVMAEASLWSKGTVEVRVGETAVVDIVLQPGVRRHVEFPVPIPDWGTPRHVRFLLRAPDGSVYDEGQFDPRDELPYRYKPAIGPGTWSVELQCDDGRRFVGTFAIASLAPTKEPIRVRVVAR